MPASDVVCELEEQGICGCPRRFKLTIQGVVSCNPDPCADCGDVDGSYILEFDEEFDQWKYEGPGVAPCWYVDAWTLEITRNEDCSLTFTVWYADTSPDDPWVLDGQYTCWPEDPLTLTGGLGCAEGCEYPTTITLEPVGISSITGNNCFGTKTSCAVSVQPQKPEAVPDIYDQFPDCTSCPTCGSPLVPSASCSGCGAPYRVNHTNGNLAVTIPTVGGGALTPSNSLTLNTQLSGPTPFGYGASSPFTAQVVNAGTCEYLLYRCDGSVFCYRGLKPDGVALAINLAA